MALLLPDYDMLILDSYLFSTEKSIITIILTLGPSRDKITATPTYWAWKFFFKCADFEKFGRIFYYNMLLYLYIFRKEYIGGEETRGFLGIM